MTCVAITARVSTTKGASDADVLAKVRSGCGFIAEEAATRMSEDSKAHQVDPRYEREFDVHFADSKDENLSALEAAGSARATKIVALVRSEDGKHNAQNQ
jgi:hypothetical protein